MSKQERVENFGVVAAASLAIAALALLASRLVAPVTSLDAVQRASAGTSIELIASARDSVRFSDELLNPLASQAEEGSPVEVQGATVPAAKLADLNAAIRAIESGGHDVGFLMLDTQTGTTVSYHADRLFYSASSIKGPYVTSVVRAALGDTAQADARIDAILRYSDNDAYASLRSQYGNDPMAALVDASGAEQLPHAGITDEVEAAAEPQSGQSIADNFYEFVTPEQMVALWDQCRAYLESGEPGAAWLANELQTPEISSLSHVGRAWGTTWAKAGWYPDDASGFATTVDAGVVRTETGDVVIAVMTTSPVDFPATAGVILPLLELHAELG